MNKLIAHRGIYNNIKVFENSYNAFLSAINKGYDIEIDIRKTSDNILVVYHDNNLKRLMDINVNIEDVTYEELNKYKYKDNTSIMTLKELLTLVNKKVGILIELKSDGCEELLLDLLKIYKGYYEIQSFNINHLINIKNIDISIKIGLLINKRLDIKTKIKLYFLKPQFLSYNYKLINQRLINKYRKYDIYVWTIKKEYINLYNIFTSIIFEE